jgi:hypothetical protein
MNLDIEILEFLDVIEYVTSSRFKEKYRHQYGSHLIQLFQQKILDAFQKKRPIALNDLVKFLTVKHSYKPELVKDFLKEVDIEILTPFVYF